MAKVVPAFLHPRSEVSSNWHRIIGAVVRGRQRLGGFDPHVAAGLHQAALGDLDRYPFLEPGVDFASTFILERPSDDWLRQVPPFYI